MSVTPTFVGSASSDYAEPTPWYKNKTVWLVGGGFLAIVIFYYLYSQNSATGSTAAVATPTSSSGTGSANELSALEQLQTTDAQILQALQSGQTSPNGVTGVTPTQGVVPNGSVNPGGGGINGITTYYKGKPSPHGFLTFMPGGSIPSGVNPGGVLEPAPMPNSTALDTLNAAYLSWKSNYVGGTSQQFAQDLTAASGGTPLTPAEALNLNYEHWLVSHPGGTSTQFATQLRAAAAAKK